MLSLAVSLRRRIAAVGTSAGILLEEISERSLPAEIATTAPTPIMLRSDPVHALAWGPDGSLLASGDARGVVTVWAMSTQTALQRLEFLTDAVRSLSFSHDGKLLAATTVNGAFCAWSVGDWKPWARISSGP